VIGGETVYAQLMDYCARAYITKIYQSRPADRFFPDIENAANWALVLESEMKEYNGIRFSYREYVNRAPQAFP
jgi:dihydrofolate reductase